MSYGTSNMAKNEKSLLHLRIGRFGKIFAPDEYGQIGVLFGKSEATEPIDVVRWHVARSSVAIIEYEYMGRYNKLYFQRGQWETDKDQHPTFHVWGLLK